MPPHKAAYIDDLVVMLPQNVWDHLYSRYAVITVCVRVCVWLEFITVVMATRYGGGPAVNHLYVCHTCQMEIEKLEKRCKNELDMFVRVRNTYTLHSLVCVCVWGEVFVCVWGGVSHEHRSGIKPTHITAL